MNTVVPTLRVLLFNDESGNAKRVSLVPLDARRVHFKLTCVGGLAQAHQRLHENPLDTVLIEMPVSDSNGTAQ